MHLKTLRSTLQEKHLPISIKVKENPSSTPGGLRFNNILGIRFLVKLHQHLKHRHVTQRLAMMYTIRGYEEQHAVQKALQCIL